MLSYSNFPNHFKNDPIVPKNFEFHVKIERMLTYITKFQIYPFKWALWRFIEKSLRVYCHQNHKRILERERWHLRGLHSESKVKFLAGHLKALSKNNVIVEVESTWIDQYPKAEFSINNGTKKSVELADILLVISLYQGQSSLLKKVGILLQAKCSNYCSKFDNTNGTSTLNERDLIESCDWPISVKSSKKGSLINPNRKGYSLQLQNGFLGYGAYLIIPNKYDQNDLPYNLLLPNSRIDNEGKVTHFSEVIKKLITENSPQFGRAINGTSQEWDFLVEDLTNYVKNTPPLQKFTHSTKYRKKPISKVIKAVYKELIQASKFLPVFHTFCVVPDTPNQIPPLDGDWDDGKEGFCLLEINLYSEGESLEFINFY